MACLAPLPSPSAGVVSAALLALTASVIGCSSPEPVVALAADVRTALVIQADDVWLVDLADDDDLALHLDPAAGPIVVLYYPATAPELGLSAAADRALVRGPEGPGADAWPLPPPTRAARYDAVSGALVDADLAAALAEPAVAAVRVPAAGCPTTRLGTSVSLESLFRGAAIFSLALNDGTAALTTAPNRYTPEHVPRTFVVVAGMVREVSLPYPPTLRSRLSVSAEGDGFSLVDTSTSWATTYRLSTSGEATVVWRVASTSVSGAEVARWPGARTLFHRDAVTGSILSLDLETGALSRPLALPQVVADPRCDFSASQHLFRLEGPETGVVGFAREAPRRFDVAARAWAPIVEGLEIPAPCQSTVLRFASGSELVLQLVGLFGDGAADVRAAWRPAGAETWVPGTYATSLHAVIPAGSWALGLDTFIDDVEVVAEDPRRLDQRPRVCGRLGAGKVRKFAADGEQGVLAIQLDGSAPWDLVFFSVTAP